MKRAFAALILVSSTSNAADFAIDTLTKRLSNRPMWEDGAGQMVHLPGTAKPADILSKLFEKIPENRPASEFHFEGAGDAKIPRVDYTAPRITEFHLEEARPVKINTIEYSASRVSTNLGEKIILMKYLGPNPWWWIRVFDAEK